MTMRLPANYLDLVTQGATVLRSLGIQLREIAVKSPDAPERWLSVRDYESLAGRLTDLGDLEWRNGFGHMVVTPQDFAVLDELLTASTLPLELSREESGVLADLSEFLRMYTSRKFELDHPAA